MAGHALGEAREAKIEIHLARGGQGRFAKPRKSWRERDNERENYRENDSEDKSEDESENYSENYSEDERE